MVPHRLILLPLVLFADQTDGGSDALPQMDCSLCGVSLDAGWTRGMGSAKANDANQISVTADALRLADAGTQWLAKRFLGDDTAREGERWKRLNDFSRVW